MSGLERAPGDSGPIPGGSGKRKETLTFGEPSFRHAILQFPVGQVSGYILSLHIMAYLRVLRFLSSVHRPNANTYNLPSMFNKIKITDRNNLLLTL